MKTSGWLPLLRTSGPYIRQIRDESYGELQGESFMPSKSGHLNKNKVKAGCSHSKHRREWDIMWIAFLQVPDNSQKLKIHRKYGRHETHHSCETGNSFLLFLIASCEQGHTVKKVFHTTNHCNKTSLALAITVELHICLHLYQSEHESWQGK